MEISFKGHLIAESAKIGRFSMIRLGDRWWVSNKAALPLAQLGPEGGVFTAPADQIIWFQKDSDDIVLYPKEG